MIERGASIKTSEQLTEEIYALHEARAAEHAALLGALARLEAKIAALETRATALEKPPKK